MNKKQVLYRLSKETVLPLIVAPMFLVSGPELVKSACKNGAIGAIPAPNARTIEILETWMKSITTELEKHKKDNPHKPISPWALNIVTHRSYDRLALEFELILKYKPPIVITALGSPRHVVESVHSYGGLVFADVNSIKYAKKAGETGVDGLILVSAGAGGHTGNITGFAFVEAVRQFWDGIIVLGGGISSGRGILAAQNLGADFVYMGTKFIAAEESLANSEYKKMVTEAEIEDILLTDAFTGVHANMLIPSIEKEGLNIKSLKSYESINFSNPQSSTKAWKNIWSAGHGVATIHEVQPVEKIISDLLKEYQDAMVTLKKDNLWTKKFKEGEMIYE